MRSGENFSPRALNTEPLFVQGEHSLRLSLATRDHSCVLEEILPTTNGAALMHSWRLLQLANASAEDLGRVQETTSGALAGR